MPCNLRYFLRQTTNNKKGENTRKITQTKQNKKKKEKENKKNSFKNKQNTQNNGIIYICETRNRTFVKRRKSSQYNQPEPWVSHLIYLLSAPSLVNRCFTSQQSTNTKRKKKKNCNRQKKKKKERKAHAHTHTYTHTYTPKKTFFLFFALLSWAHKYRRIVAHFANARSEPVEREWASVSLRISLALFFHFNLSITVTVNRHTHYALRSKRAKPALATEKKSNQLQTSRSDERILKKKSTGNTARHGCLSHAGGSLPNVHIRVCQLKGLADDLPMRMSVVICFTLQNEKQRKKMTIDLEIKRKNKRN